VREQPDNPPDATTYQVEQERRTRKNHDDERSPGSEFEKPLPSRGHRGKEPFHDCVSPVTAPEISSGSGGTSANP